MREIKLGGFRAFTSPSSGVSWGWTIGWWGKERFFYVGCHVGKHESRTRWSVVIDVCLRGE